MIYRILRQLARLAFAIYFRRIYLVDQHHLPKDGPVLLACNHPSAFMEACVLSGWSHRPLHYLTRGDFFKNAMFKWFLLRTHQIPIYRTRDGFSNLRQNKSTFDACFERLKDGKVIMIFPEARTILEKRLRPVQKGAARIVFGAKDAYGTDTVVVPMGITFSDPRRLGGVAYFKFGEPIPLEDYHKISEDQPKLANEQLTQELELSMKRLIVNIDDPAREKTFDEIWELAVFERDGFPKVSQDGTHLSALQSLASHLNSMSDEAHLRLRQLIDAAGVQMLRSAILTQRSNPLIGNFGLPFLMVGKACNWIPAFCTRRVVRGIKAETFQGPVHAVLGFVIHGLFYLLLTLSLMLICLSCGWIIGIVALMLGYFAYHDSNTNRYWYSLKFRMLPQVKRAQISQVLDDIQKLIEIH